MVISLNSLVDRKEQGFTDKSFNELKRPQSQLNYIGGEILREVLTLLLFYSTHWVKGTKGFNVSCLVRAMDPTMTQLTCAHPLRLLLSGTPLFTSASDVLLILSGPQLSQLLMSSHIGLLLPVRCYKCLNDFPACVIRALWGLAPHWMESFVSRQNSKHIWSKDAIIWLQDYNCPAGEMSKVSKGS